MKRSSLIYTGLAAMAAVLVAALLLETTELLGVRAEFWLFTLTLLGVALLHEHTLAVALTGLAFTAALKLSMAPDFHPAAHVLREAPILVNLLGLLLGFALLARHFEQSDAPELLPRLLPDGWPGGLALLAMVFVLSAFLDNIAAAMVGGTVALHVYKKRVDIGFLAAIVAASNAGGAGSMLGDTTTTMMWIDGVAWTDVLHAYAAAVPALLLFGVIAARQQHAFQPIQEGVEGRHSLHWRPLAAVLLILCGAIVANLLLDFPAAGVWMAIALAAPFTRTDWKVVATALPGSLFLVALVSCASLMPVETLPPASWQSAFVLGLVSSVFDNIPLTKLALDQGGYDWGVLAYSVGFGGSMIWFGSSAGVAISTLFPEARSVGRWLARGWHVVLAYVLGFAVLLGTLGWQAHAPHRPDQASPDSVLPSK